MYGFDPSEARATYVGKYGTRHVGPAARDCKQRLDRWTSASSGDVVFESIFTAGPHDISDHHSVQGSYSAKCSCCWLNFGHTAEAHAAKLAQADE